MMGLKVMAAALIPNARPKVKGKVLEFSAFWENWSGKKGGNPQPHFPFAAQLTLVVLAPRVFAFWARAWMNSREGG